MPGRPFHRPKRFLTDEHGGVSVALVLMLIPMIAALGMAVEGSSWFFIKRAMQNASDSAAMAASLNGCATVSSTCYSTYVTEAKSVASQFGFKDGQANVTVTAVNNARCPDNTFTCYGVSIQKPVQISLVGFAGYRGNAVVSGSRAVNIAASAVASPPGPPTGFCMIGLSTSGNSIRINGGPNVNLAGCDLYGNSDLTCNGANSDTGVLHGYAHGSSGCGATKVNSAPVLADPFSALNANPPIPADTCGGSYPQGVAGPTLDGTAVWTSPVKKCGDLRLTTDVNITTANSVLVVDNGHLDLNGHKLSTSGSGSLTIIFSAAGPTSGGATTYHHYPVNSTGTGTIDIAAPNSLTNPLHGMAIVQDSRLTGNKNDLAMTYHGNDPTLDIQGIIYMPKGNFSVAGAINLHSSGLSCVAIVANSVLVSGQGAIFNHATSQCAAAGATLPPVPGTTTRQSLVG